MPSSGSCHDAGVTRNKRGRSLRTTRAARRRVSSTGLILLAISTAIAIVGAWVVAADGIGYLWFYATAVIAVVMLFVGYPYARACGHPGEGAVAVWIALVLGPVSLIVLGPWAQDLGSRFEAEQGR